MSPEEDALHEKVFETGLLLEDAAVEFVLEHPEIRLAPCGIISAFVLAVDRYMDVYDDLHDYLDHQEEEGRNAT
jgi:hypothetical protein